MLRQLYKRNTPLRSPLKISSVLYSKYRKIAFQNHEEFTLAENEIETHGSSGRYKHKEQEEEYKNKALKSFDDLYQKVYKDAWPSMRVGLLCPSKTALLVNNFSDPGRIMNELEDKGLLFVSSLFETRLAELSAAEEETDSDSENDFASIKDKDRQGEETDSDNLEKLKGDAHGLSTQTHLTKKIHEDPTANVPLQETLAAAKIDRSRIIEPQETGTALSAALYEFIPATEVMGKDPDWVLSADRYQEYEKSATVLVDVEPEETLHFPPSLLVYSYERGNVLDYDYPRMGSSRTIDFEEIELGNLLPVLALGIEPKDKVLDMCTQSIEFGLMMLQTLYPDFVVMNIHSDQRIGKVQSKLNVTFRNSEHAPYKVTKKLPADLDGEFNKILLCVPNLDDRKCLSSYQTYFHPMLSKDRLLLPDIQADFLIDAIKLVQLGGTVVYSTTTLSPLQNEGVIRSAIAKLRYDHDIEVKVKDLTQALRPLDTFFKFASSKEVSLGHMAVPFLPLNCGPVYFCKLEKVSEPGASTDEDH